MKKAELYKRNVETKYYNSNNKQVEPITAREKLYYAITGRYKIIETELYLCFFLYKNNKDLENQIYNYADSHNFSISDLIIKKVTN